jgi:hypothetical protein
MTLSAHRAGLNTQNTTHYANITKKYCSRAYWFNRQQEGASPIRIFRGSSPNYEMILRQIGERILCCL